MSPRRIVSIHAASTRPRNRPGRNRTERPWTVHSRRRNAHRDLPDVDAMALRIERSMTLFAYSRRAIFADMARLTEWTHGLDRTTKRGASPSRSGRSLGAEMIPSGADPSGAADR